MRNTLWPMTRYYDGVAVDERFCGLITRTLWLVIRCLNGVIVDK